MCPGGHKPDGLVRDCVLNLMDFILNLMWCCTESGQIANNEFFTCPNVSAIFVNPAIPGCADNMVMKNNTIQPASQVSINEIHHQFESILLGLFWTEFGLL